MHVAVVAIVVMLLPMLCYCYGHDYYKITVPFVLLSQDRKCQVLVVARLASYNEGMLLISTAQNI